MFLGFDISKWQWFLTYHLLRLYFSFGFIKYASGIYKDPKYDEHASGIGSQEIPFGPYLWLYPWDIIPSVRGLLAEGRKLKLMPVLDIEDYRLLREHVALAIKTWQEEVSFPGIVYTRPDIWNKVGVPLPKGWVLWLAMYPRNWLGIGPLTKLSASDNILGKVAAWLTTNSLPLMGGQKPKLWQFDDKAMAVSFGTDPYKSLSLDLNVLLGTLDEIAIKENYVSPDPVPSTRAPLFRVSMTTANLNGRKEPAGAWAQKMPVGEYDIFATETKSYLGVSYIWGEVESGIWFALQKENGSSVYATITKVYDQPRYFAVALLEDGEFYEMIEVTAKDSEDAIIVAVQLAAQDIEGDIQALQVLGPYEKA